MKIISIWSVKGGVGKTTLALHLAEALTRDNKRVLLFDSDDQKSALEVHSHSEEFTFDAVGELPDDVTMYDYLIVDFPPTSKALNSVQRKLLKHSHHILSPLRASRLDLMSFKKIKTDFADDARFIPILSAYDARIADQKSVRLEVAKNYPVISYLSVYSRALNACKSVFSTTMNNVSQSSKARNEMKKIVELVK
mgnify:FL=1